MEPAEDRPGEPRHGFADLYLGWSPGVGSGQATDASEEKREPGERDFCGESTINIDQSAITPLFTATYITLRRTGGRAEPPERGSASEYRLGRAARFTSSGAESLTILCEVR